MREPDCRAVGGMTRWVVGMVLTSLVASVGYLLVQDRVRIERDIIDLHGRDDAMSSLIASINRDITAGSEQRDALKQSIDDLRDGQKRLDNKIDLILAEMGRNRK